MYIFLKSENVLEGAVQSRKLKQKRKKDGIAKGQVTDNKQIEKRIEKKIDK